MDSVNSSKNEFSEVVDGVRGSFDAGFSLPMEFRIQQLKNILKLFNECEQEILDALHRDIRKSPYEARMGDVKTVVTEVLGMLNHLKEYTANEKLPYNLLTLTDTGYIRKEPYGLVLIIGTWNYPFQSTLQPLVGAIGAGNCAIIKPSEVTPTCADTLARLVSKYLDPRCYQIVTGDVDATKNLLKNKFDYIFCTGSPVVGRSILQAAAPHLTPCTLELGGKNPCYIDKSANFRLAAKRIIWGKLINDGQICVCPDYVLCTKSAQDDFIKVAKEVLQEWYGSDPQKTPDIIRIVNNRHFHRLQKLLQTTNGEIAVGGYTDEADLWIEPTIVVNVKCDDSLMADEIFGPILPIVPVQDVDEAIRVIRSKPKPLSLYIFADDKSVTQKVLNSTSSGNGCVNDVFWQGTWIGLPFGGVGNSGMGRFHGKATFDTFSHSRSILERPIDFISEALCSGRYPPFTNGKYLFFSWMIRNFERCNVERSTCSHIFAFVLGVVLALLIVFLVAHFA